MKRYYIGLATGKVAHIQKPNSFLKGQTWNDKSFLLCGRYFNPTLWFESGIDRYGDRIPFGVEVCKVCERKAIDQ